MTSADEPFTHGLDFFNSGRYFEAHEVWELIWRSADEGQQKETYQGLIQAAVGLHHLNQGNPAGARGLLTRALEKLSAAPSFFLEVDIGRLREDLKLALEELTPRMVRIRGQNPARPKSG